MLQEHLISHGCAAREALARLDSITGSYRQALFVYDTGHKIIGSVTDGDIRRGLINGLDIDKPVEVFMNRHFHHFQKDRAIDPKSLRALRSENITIIPVLHPDHTLDKIINLHDLRSVLPVSALIIAGGKGLRLSPMTDHTPKPLLPVGGKPIIEHMLGRLMLYGIAECYISLHHMGEQITGYLGDGSSRGIHIQYLHEEEPRGTLGAASMINDVQHDYVIVQNADLLCNIDYEALYLFGKDNDFDVVVATFPFQVNIPYAVVEAGKQHTVAAISEKPSYTFHSNTGIYLFKTTVFDRLPRQGRVDTPDFLRQLLLEGYNIGHFPYIDYWLDIGSPEDYLRAQEDIKHLRLYE